MSSSTYLADCASTTTCDNKMAGLGTEFVIFLIGAGVSTVWLVMWPIALWSVVAEPTGKTKGMVWAAIVTFLPFIGAVAFWTRNRWGQSDIVAG